MALDQHHEIDPGSITRDTRSVWDRTMAGLFRPANYRNALIAFAVVQLALPALWPVWVFILLITNMSFADQKFMMPLRLPKDVGGVDKTDFFEELIEESKLFGLIRKSRTARRFLAAGGILYLGFLRSPDREEQGF